MFFARTKLLGEVLSVEEGSISVSQNELYTGLEIGICAGKLPKFLAEILHCY